LRYQVDLDTPDDNNITLRSKLEQVYNTCGVYDERLDVPSIPRELEYIMGWFWEIRSAVGGNGFGANPISFTELYSWSYLYSITLSSWELSIIRKLDFEYIKITSKKSNDKIKNK
jgi:hypothetical protein